MKKLRCIIFILLFAVLICACQDAETTGGVAETTPTVCPTPSDEPISYELFSEDGKAYVRVSGITYHDDASVSTGIPIPLVFESFQEMKSTVLNQRLTDVQIRQLAEHCRIN